SPGHTASLAPRRRRGPAFGDVNVSYYECRSSSGRPISRMKKILACIALVVLATLTLADPGYARGGGHGGHPGGHFAGVPTGRFAGDPGFNGGFAHHPHFDGRRHARVFVGVAPFVTVPFWWDYPAYAYVPPPVVEEPPVYIEQLPTGPSEWYYCQSANSYYPTVQTCPEPWIRVPATPR